MRKLKIGFILLTPHADPSRDIARIENEDATIMFVIVNNYDVAEEYARAYARLGCDTIELCPAFKHEGVARVQKAAGDIPVGVVRFDTYPTIV